MNRLWTVLSSATHSLGDPGQLQAHSRPHRKNGDMNSISLKGCYVRKANELRAGPQGPLVSAVIMRACSCTCASMYYRKDFDICTEFFKLGETTSLSLTPLFLFLLRFSWLLLPCLSTPSVGTSLSPAPTSEASVGCTEPQLTGYSLALGLPFPTSHLRVLLLLT